MSQKTDGCVWLYFILALVLLSFQFDSMERLNFTQNRIIFDQISPTDIEYNVAIQRYTV